MTSLSAAAAVEMESMRKTAELDKKSYDDLVRERDILSKAGSWPHTPLPHPHSIFSPGPTQGRGHR